MSWSLQVRREPDPQSLAGDVRVGLTQKPVSFPPKWFYDEKGSQLFDAITELAEYYPTRAEQQVLDARAGELPRRGTLVELGAGYSRKTQTLLTALAPTLFVPLDVAAEPLTDAATRIVKDFPQIDVLGIVADFTDDLAPLPGASGDRMVAFLGSTIGNLHPDQRADFLRRVQAATDPGDLLLLGADLVKDVGRLIAAYDDSEGVTAAFNKNLLEVIARELDADLDPEAFTHVARYDVDLQRIEMRLRSTRSQDVPVRALDLVWHLDEGEELLTETSHKFTLDGIGAEVGAAGFTVREQWTDPDGDFSLTLAERT